MRTLRNNNNPPSEDNTATIHLSGAVHYVDATVALDARDSYLTIKNYNGEKVILSGGVLLNTTWNVQGDIRTAQFTGSCGEAYLGDYRLLKARSPNIADYGVNKHYATGPYHKVAGFLIENDDCKLETNQFSQQNCPEENKNGFYLNDEMSGDWENVDQTEILFFHSWINEYARVSSVTPEGGRNKVLFQEPLSHAAVGTWIRSGGLRYLVVNNIAVLDQPGEYVCTEQDGVATLSWIPPAGADHNSVPVMTNVEIILQIINAGNVAVEGIEFQHTSYDGLDRNMDWQHAAIVVKKSNGINLKKYV